WPRFECRNCRQYFTSDDRMSGRSRALKFHLREKGFQGPDLDELEKAIKADEKGPKLTGHHFGENVGDWLAGIVRKAANGFCFGISHSRTRTSTTTRTIWLRLRRVVPLW